MTKQRKGIGTDTGASLQHGEDVAHFEFSS